jgi:hypothetical protein
MKILSYPGFASQVTATVPKNMVMKNPLCKHAILACILAATFRRKGKPLIFIIELKATRRPNGAVLTQMGKFPPGEA